MSSSSVVKAGLRDLGTEQLSALKTAVSHLLSTSIAEQTYAQIVDGLPTSDVWDGYTNERHEPIENHHSLCAGSLETAKALRSTFDTSNLFLDASVGLSISPFLFPLLAVFPVGGLFFSPGTSDLPSANTRKR